MDSSENKWICSFCNIILDSEESLQAHLVNHSSKSVNVTIIHLPLQLFTDKNESYIFPVKDRISSQFGNNFPKSKIGVKSQDKAFQYCVYACSTCGKEFKRKDHLDKHVIIHSGIKPFICLICGRSFSRKDRLKEHCAIHVSKGWSCYFCGKMFSQRSILRVHEMIHRGIKPYVCDLCDRSFSRKNDLFRHQTTHSGEKSHFCGMCGKGFTQKRLVKRHGDICKGKEIKVIKQLKYLTAG